MRTGKRMVGVGLVIAVILTVFSGCAQPEEAQVVQIQFMHGWGASKPIHEAMRDIYSRFSVQNQVSVSVVAAPDNSVIIDRAGDMLAVGQMADIVSTNGIASFIHHAANKGMTLNLMPYIEADEVFRDSIDPSVFNHWQQGDSLYTVPDALEVKGYWYNADILSKAGFSGVPKTWTEFWGMCSAVSAWARKENNGITVFAMEKEQAVEGLLLALIAASDEGIPLTVGRPEDYGHPRIRAALDGIRTAYGYSKVLNGLEDTRQAFRDGTIAVYCNGLWEIDEIQGGSAEAHIRYANYPAGSGKSLSYVSPASGYVLHKSGDPAREQASVDFLKFLLDEKQQTDIAINTGQVPCNPHIDFNLLAEKRPVFAQALQEARSADIQIPSIGAVWDGPVIDMLKEKIDAFGADRLSLDELISLISA